MEGFKVFVRAAWQESPAGSLQRAWAGFVTLVVEKAEQIQQDILALAVELHHRTDSARVRVQLVCVKEKSMAQQILWEYWKAGQSKHFNCAWESKGSITL